MKSENNTQLAEAPKKKQHRYRKQSHKDLLNMYYDEIGIEKPGNNGGCGSSSSGNSSTNGAPNYKNQQIYMSANERKKFEERFTVPKGGHQEEYCAMLKRPSKKIIVVSGPAGTGKTLFATEHGVKNFLWGVYDKLVFTRPSVSVDEDLGYLPGTLEDKMAPWVRPIYDVLYQFISPKEVQQCMEDKLIEIAPLGFMRGRTFKNTWIVADEMQNSTISQMKMLLTRLGENSRLIITGDLEQFDRSGERNGLEDFLEKFRGKRSKSIGSFEFERHDIQREDVVKEVLEIYAGEHLPENYMNEASSSSSSSNQSDSTIR